MIAASRAIWFFMHIFPLLQETSRRIHRQMTFPIRRAFLIKSFFTSTAACMASQLLLRQWIYCHMFRLLFSIFLFLQQSLITGAIEMKCEIIVYTDLFIFFLFRFFKSSNWRPPRLLCFQYIQCLYGRVMMYIGHWMAPATPVRQILHCPPCIFYKLHRK